MRIRTWVPGVLLLAAGTAVVIFVGRFEQRMERVEKTIRSLIQMQERPYFKIDGHVYYQQPGETREAWNARVKRVVAGTEDAAQYICTTLRGCDVPGGIVEVCTPCNSSPPSPQCIANHQADIDAACVTFDCTDCGT